jgi:AcrR family transcriptional regulator
VERETRTRKKKAAAEKTAPGRASRKQAKREGILKAAGRVFSAQPYPAASMRMIAKEAGLDYHLILYYFPSKADLFRALLQKLTDEFSRAMPGWFEELDRMSRPQAVSAYFDRAIGFHRDHPEFHRIVLLNMVQSIRKPTLIPGYEYIQKATAFGKATFGERSRSEIAPAQMDYLTTAVGMLFITLLGGSAYHAEIRGLDPESDAYRAWVKELILFMVLPVLDTFQARRGHPANPGKSLRGR